MACSKFDISLVCNFIWQNNNRVKRLSGTMCDCSDNNILDCSVCMKLFKMSRITVRNNISAATTKSGCSTSSLMRKHIN